MCYSDNLPPELWIELNVWGDMISLVLAWESAFNLTSPTTGSACSGTISATLASPSIAGDGTVTATAAVTSDDTDGGRMAMLLQSRASDGALVSGSNSDTKAHQVAVTTSTSGATVVTRADTRDVLVEIPTS